MALTTAPVHPLKANNRPRPMDVEEIFGENVFWDKELASRLSKSAYKQLRATIDNRKPLSPDLADAIADAMKEWAITKGATHYTHWFQPLTGRTAEKHDSFITPNEGGGAISTFSGKNLIQGEPDASSFPSGGLRATFEARGYTAYDPTSPAFIIENTHGATLCIPTAFASWTGEALDNKTPLLRSEEVLNRQALRALRLLGDKETERVFSTLGAEQEYFLLDEALYNRRQDLMATGRTLIGAKPAKGQELDDHYFGTIPHKVLDFMMDAERELYRLGIPIKTRHNEVAPGQYEIAPLFESSNVAADHQQLVMLVLQRKARDYGLVTLLHEKPFSGVNGSGKHCNYAMATDTGENLLEPGDTPHENLVFLFFCTAILLSVYRYQDMLRIAVASAGNDHRLGANEAPPAIISVFLGDQLTEIYDELHGNGKATRSRSSGFLGLGTPVLPEIPRHASDRNRTSPFAFTGNKFEFRAVGSAQSVSFNVTLLNTAISESVEEMSDMLEAKLKEYKGKKALEKALSAVIKSVMEEAYPIIFNGDNYSQEWQLEAAERGLLNLPTCADALEHALAEKNVQLFGKTGVLTEQEMRSRHEIAVERYVTTVAIEASTLESLARTAVLPAAIRYLREALETADEVQDFEMDASALLEIAEEVNDLVDDLHKSIRELSTVRKGIPEGSAAARYMADTVRPAMATTRQACDGLEALVPSDLWPLPTYREMLFSNG